MKKKGLIIPIAIVFSLVAVILLQIQKEDLKGSFVESPEIEETKLNESEQKMRTLFSMTLLRTMLIPLCLILLPSGAKTA